MLLKQLTSINLVAAQELRDEAFFEPLNLKAEMSAYVSGVCVYGYDENSRWVGPKPERVACKGVNLSDPYLLERALEKPDLGVDALVVYGLFDVEELVGLTIFHSCFNLDNSQWLVIDLLAVKATAKHAKEQCAVILLTEINKQFENQYTSIKLNHRKNFNVAIGNLPIPGNTSPLINQEFVPLSVILGEKSIAFPAKEPNVDSGYGSISVVSQVAPTRVISFTIPKNLRIPVSTELENKLQGFAKTLNQGDITKNETVVQATQTLIDEVLGQFVGGENTFDNDAFEKAVKTYEETVTNLSLQQKLFIAAMTFLGALVGFIVGAAVGAAISGLNPIAAVAAGVTGAVVGGSLGAGVIGVTSFGLARFGVFKCDPVKNEATELLDLLRKSCPAPA